MKEIDDWENIEEEVELDLDHVVIVAQDHDLLVADHHLYLVSVDLAARLQNEDHRDLRYRSELAVVLQNVDQEAAVSPLAGLL
jgi:hypothetical protein